MGRKNEGELEDYLHKRYSNFHKLVNKKFIDITY